MEIDLDADLVPGVGAAGLTIGQPIKSLLEIARLDSVEQRMGLRVLKYALSGCSTKMAESDCTLLKERWLLFN
jgi:hypothetical protein